MGKFLITYQDPESDPDAGMKTIVKEFEGTSICSAYEWAVDYAYTLSDKGPYFVTEVIENE